MLKSRHTEAELKACDDEPIHQLNLIQPTGLIIVVNPADWTVVQCSDNVSHFIPHSPASMPGQPLAFFTGPDYAEQLARSFQEQSFEKLNPQQIQFLPQTDFFWAVAHVSGGLLVIDLEPIRSQSEAHGVPLTEIEKSIERFQRTHSLQELAQQTAEEIRQYTGYDRVMVYQFDPEWNGKVIAEAKSPRLDPFFGQYFPATDIPQQARRLYAMNHVRMITDITAQPARLVPAQNPLVEKGLLDLSNSFLRHVSSVHIEYLHNMGVTATLTISILQKGKLWGLVACHHHTPKILPYPLRLSMVHLAKLFSYHLQIQEDIEHYHFYLEIKAKENELVKIFGKELNLADLLTKYTQLFLSLNSAEGLFIQYDKKFYALGKIPPITFIHGLIDWLHIHQKEDIFATHCLSSQYLAAKEQAETASGVLSMRLSKTLRNYVIWFKPEIVQSRHWGGNPHEKIVLSDGEKGLRLSPRKSFELWEEMVEYESEPWKESEIQIAKSLYKSIMELLATKLEWVELQKANLELLVQERTFEIQRLYDELQVSEEELRSNHEQLLETLQAVKQLNRQLKEAHANIRALFDSTSNVIFYLDKDYKINFFNKIAQENAIAFHNLPLKAGDNFIEKYIPDPIAVEVFKANFHKALLGQRFHIEDEITYSETLSIWHRTEFCPVFDEKGDEINGVAINIINIDETKKSEIKIREQLNALNKIAFMQSHEVRRPVSSILGLIGLFNRDDYGDPFNAIVLEKMLAATEELDQVIHRIVKASSLDLT
jgi:light-regulated signal transduction histidine kinase (bacteriophytochrome)